MNEIFKGKRALVFGVANERSLAWAISKKLHEGGCELGFTYLGETLERRVRPLAEKCGSKIIAPCDVTSDTQLDELFSYLDKEWGQFDFLIHSIAFANKEDLEGRFVDTTRDGYLKAIEISAYSLVDLTRRSEPFMKKAGGGSVVTLSYYGAEKVVPNYNIMGVAKATLEATTRYLANDLGVEGIKVNAISAGPVKTLAAAGIKGFKSMLTDAAEKTPLRETIVAEDVGEMGAFLCGPGGRHITGATLYVDSGAHIMA